MEEAHRNIVESYATIHYNQLLSYGLWIEKEDLIGEFYVCYAKALKMFKTDMGAKFETFLITIIKNRFRDIRNKLFYDLKCSKAQYQESKIDETEIESSLEAKEIVKNVYSKLSKREQIVMHDMIDPSAELMGFIPADCSPRQYMGHLQRAISYVRGFHYNEVKYSVSKIRKKVKKHLTYK